MKKMGRYCQRAGKMLGRSVDDIFPKLHATNVAFMPAAANDLCQALNNRYQYFKEAGYCFLKWVLSGSLLSRIAGINSIPVDSLIVFRQAGIINYSRGVHAYADPLQILLTLQGLL